MVFLGPENHIVGTWEHKDIYSIKFKGWSEKKLHVQCRGTQSKLQNVLIETATHL